MSNKLAIITGASTGIGFELATLAARNGYDLLVVADEPLIEAAATDFKTTPDRPHRTSASPWPDLARPCRRSESWSGAAPAACIQLTLKTAAKVGFPTDRLIFEFTENEEIVDPEHVSNIVETYRAMGFGTALDDFGAGHAGLNLLARFQPDIIKLDMDLVRGLDASLPRRMIVESVVRLSERLGITVVAEGIETVAELAAIEAIGIRYVQGYVFAKPGLRMLPPIAPVVDAQFALSA